MRFNPIALSVNPKMLNNISDHLSDVMIRSTSPTRTKRREYLYVIRGTNLDGLVIYTKKKFAEAEGTEMYYLLVSSKRAMWKKSYDQT
jgi:hypothetical protein